MRRSRPCRRATSACHADMILKPFDLASPLHQAAAAFLWTAACGPDLAITPRFVSFNLQPCTGKVQAGRLAFGSADNVEPVGFVTASALPGDPLASWPGVGHIDAIAVAPAAQGRGVGSALLAWAEGWVREQGRRHAVLGASQRPFVPGIPVELNSASFFLHRGYTPNPGYETVWDMAHDLRDYGTPPTATKARDVIARPARPGDEEALLGFLRREFPGGWRYEAEELLRVGLRISDYILLWSERGVDGCCLVTLEDSLRPMDRFYPYKLPRLWGQLGSIGISTDRRGLGYGAALLDAGLRHLRDNGVRGCIIDWLVLVDFYARFGFRTFRQYQMLSKKDV